MRNHDLDLHTFGGRLCIRRGWYWVPATFADLDVIGTRKDRKENIAWAVTFALAAVVWIAALVKECL